MLKALRTRKIPRMLRALNAYKEIMTRMFDPIVAGYKKVGTMEWLLAEFEPDNPFDDLFPAIPKELHEHARNEGLRMFNASLDKVKDDIHNLAVSFLGKPSNKKMTWNATCGENLTTNLATYFSLTLSEWTKTVLEEYKFKLSGELSKELRDELANYVCEFVGTAMASVPYFLDEATNYYDSHTDYE